MKNIFQKGDQLSIEIKVSAEDTAMFNGQEVHPVYSTFALGRDAEWACRQFVLEMREESEEGIGTFLTVNHHSPAKVGDQVVFVATVDEIKGNEIICQYEARKGNRLIASGKQGQKILEKTKIQSLFDSL